MEETTTTRCTSHMNVAHHIYSSNYPPHLVKIDVPYKTPSLYSGNTHIEFEWCALET
jgi:hypothetical protein